MSQFWKRFAQDATHTVQDVYSHWVLGDDAGKSAVFTWLCDADTPDLGIRFIEIHGRAYVKSVAGDSPAAAAGVSSQDAVQLAVPVTGKHAIQYALDLEHKGNRIHYDQLFHLLKASPQHFLSPPVDKEARTKHQEQWNGPPIPSTICAPILIPADGSSSSDSTPDSGAPPTNNFTASDIFHQRQPILFVFRRTRQRKGTSALSFRLDDECDLACSLVKRLAPTPEQGPDQSEAMEDDLMHDGTDSGSGLAPSFGDSTINVTDLDEGIPLNEIERKRAERIGVLRSRMTSEAMQVEKSDDVEAATIRGMIQKAVGLAFVRANKVVMGVSLHGGSGIVIARLPDGTWSAPSAIGVWGVGLGLQFGVEVAEYIFILQTAEALHHFRKGDSYTVGGNLGMAVGSMGREAYGAASLGGGCGATMDAVQNDDEYTDHADPRATVIAPIVAYAKSQGLYVGVSLEGSRIFTRDDVNSRTYKFAIGREASSGDILSGNVGTPREAEELYAALHSVEFTHEMSCLPRPPEILRRDSIQPWNYEPGREPSVFSRMDDEENDECAAFETRFKNFMYGGVSVQRLLPDPAGGRTAKERRTLWLMLPEVGSLRLGFVSRLSDGEGEVSNKSSTQRARLNDDTGTVGSEDLTLDTAIQTRDGSTIGPMRSGNVHLSDKHSMALTDVTVLTQDPPAQIKLTGDDKSQHLRVISICDVSGASLIFLANNFREAELLICGLKLLLERETLRLSVRGGIPVTALAGRSIDESMSPSAARGFREAPAQSPEGPSADSWGKVPSRNYLRGKASTSPFETDIQEADERGARHYVHGKQLTRHLAQNVRLFLPLAVCRVLLLDKTSPVIEQWEADRGDKNFQKSTWSFPPATPREFENHTSEHDLIASGSMNGALRTSAFDRPRYGSVVQLSETHTVEADDAMNVVYTVTERNPRRGFSLRVRIHLVAVHEDECDASIRAEIRPVGKDMSNQAAVHKAFCLVVEELEDRYGTKGSGLLSGFLSVIQQFLDSKKQTTPPMPPPPPERSADISPKGSAMSESGLVSFEDMLKTGRESPLHPPRPVTPSILMQAPEPNPSKRIVSKKKKKKSSPERLVALQQSSASKKESLLIEVKPLPKIRLSLMPSPREEDELGGSSDDEERQSGSQRRRRKRRPSRTRRKKALSEIAEV